MSAAALAAAYSVALSFTIGVAIYLVATPRRPSTQAISSARRWFAWAGLVVSGTSLPRFFSQGSIEALAKWLIGTIAIGGAAAALGWGYGWFQAKRGRGLQTPALGARSEDHAAAEQNATQSSWRGALAGAVAGFLAYAIFAIATHRGPHPLMQFGLGLTGIVVVAGALIGAWGLRH